MATIETDRLILRQWQECDRVPFAVMNADPQVMRYFPNIRSKQQSDATIEYCRASIAKNGWGFWAAELRKSREFIGFIGLNRLSHGLPFSPCVEIGWRLSKEFWRRGYASEGARAALKFAFEQTESDKIVAFTPKSNTPSMGVMRKIGMTDSLKNFIHPDVPTGHKLSEHVLYTITKSEFLALNQT